MKRPPALAAPGPIGIIAPASAPRQPDLLGRGIDRLRGLGFSVVHEPPPGPPRGYLAASDRDRADELNRMLRRTDIPTLFCARGGYGAMRLLDRLDWDAARAHPKLLVGYSDITALQLALLRHAGWASLSGPMVGVEWPDPEPRSEAHFFGMASGGAPRELLNPDGSGLVPLRAGVAEGLLVGGNLSMIARLVGTPHLPDLEGAVLFFEEVGEMPYRVDALLAQLGLAGVLRGLAGVVVGGITESEVPADRPTLTVDQVLLDWFGDAPYPVATGLLYGHFPLKATVPIGVRARLEVSGSSARLDLLESVVA